MEEDMAKRSENVRGDYKREWRKNGGGWGLHLILVSLLPTHNSLHSYSVVKK